jgi:DNA-binding NtrC family response regulator
MTPDSSYATLDAALPELLGTSPPMRELLAIVRQVAPYVFTVLITGGIDPEAHPDLGL